MDSGYRIKSGTGPAGVTGLGLFSRPSDLKSEKGDFHSKTKAPSKQFLNKVVQTNVCLSCYFEALTLSRILPSISSNFAGTGGYHLTLAMAANGKER